MPFAWFENNKEFANAHCFRMEGDPEGWGRLVCEWNEFNETKTHYVTHLYVAVINFNNGHLWIETTRKIVYMKFFLQLFRVVHALCKMVYHVFIPISIPCEIYLEMKACKKSQEPALGRVIIRIMKSVADILRTPLFELILIAYTITALVITPFQPRWIFPMMERSGQIEKKLYWGQKQAPGTLAVCFQSNCSIRLLNRKWNTKRNKKGGEIIDTYYTEAEKEPLGIALANYARRWVIVDRKMPPPFFLKDYEEKNNARISNCIHKLIPLDQAGKEKLNGWKRENGTLKKISTES